MRSLPGGFTLTQTVGLVSLEKTTLTQTYVMRNDTGTAQAYSMVRHVDGDMSFVGGLSDDFAGVSLDGRFAFEFDTADSQGGASAYFGINSAGDGTHIGYSVQPYAFYPDIEAANGIPIALRDQISGDANADRLTDSGYDVTISLQDDFSVAPGATVTYTTVTTFATGSPLDVINAGTFSVQETNYVANESGGALVVTVERLRGLVGDVTVDYASSDVNATAGVDYTGVSGTLTFLEGQRTATFTVPVLDDALVEGPETFTLTLSNPTGGTSVNPALSKATVRIVDDDTAIQFASPTYSVREDGVVAVVRVDRVGVLTGTGTVAYATSDGTATGGVDYTAVSGTLPFATGQAFATFEVPVTRTDAQAVEADETINVTLSNATGTNTALGSPAATVVTLLNVDEISPALTGVAIQSDNARKRITSITATFSEPMSVLTRSDPRGFTIWSRGADGRNGSGADKSVRIKSVTYDAATNTTTVTPRKPLPFNRVYQLSLNAAFLTDAGGNNVLDANADGVAGENHQQFFGRGSKLTYVDRDGDKVILKASKGGVIELIRDFDGEGQTVNLVVDTGTTTVTGLLKQTRLRGGGFSGGQTSFDYTGRARSGLFNGNQFITAV